MLGRALLFELQLAVVDSLDRGDSDVDRALVFVGTQRVELFASRDEVREPVGIVEQLPHNLPRRGQDLFACYFHVSRSGALTV
jgi:hypothetical protein